MKNFLLSAALLSMTVSAAWAVETVNEPVMKSAPVMKALPIYSNTLISKAPAGEVVTGVRDCFSYYYQSGVSYRNREEGVLGEYVIGDDGYIYLRAVCYSAARISDKTDTYLKLEKVDDTTYVAHTPQLIWVDEDTYGSPFTAYATRVVFSQKSATSFGYEVQQTPEGGYDTDVYFTLKDGRLSQMNMNTVEMNGEILPEELIGFTNSSGGWIGFGDGCIDIYTPDVKPTVLPEGAEVVKKSLDYTLLHVRDKVLDNATLINYAEVGDELYISNPSSKTEQWIKGSIDRNNGTVTFEKQYLGIDEEEGYAVWFIPVTYGKDVEIFDEETGYGDWFRTYSPAESLEFTYTDGHLALKDQGKAMYFSHSPEELLATGVYADPAVVEYKDVSLIPASVTFTKFEPMEDFWGMGTIGFAIPAMSVDGVYIPTEELYYRVFPDDSTEPFEFTPEDYWDMENDGMTDVPYSYYEDFDFRVNGVNHTVNFYHEWKKVGVQVVQKHDGVETLSEIVYAWEGGTSGVDAIDSKPDMNGKTYKALRNGEIVIVRDGVRYNAVGTRIR